MANMCHNLRLGHFVGRFHRDDLRASSILFETPFQFALGLPGTKDQNRSGITKMGNDQVVAAPEMPGVLSLACIIGWNSLVFESAGGRLAGRPKLFFDARL